MLFKASAPGSLMLLGEYAVLHGKKAVVAAVDKRITVSLTPRADTQIILESALGQLQTDLAHLTVTPPFQFVLAAFMAVKKHLRHGCHLTIEAEFSATVGFASSAAVTVATLMALSAWLHLSFSKRGLILLARQVVRTVQGLGSGADVAACVLGGVIAYRAQPFFIEQLPFIFPLTVIYSGAKTPTPAAIQKVTQTFAAHPQLFKQLCRAIHCCAQDGISAIKVEDWIELGKIFAFQQNLLTTLGVNTLALKNIVEKLQQQPTIFGAKISGSGFGDCVIGLGSSTPLDWSAITPNAVAIPLKITNEGVQCEKI